MQQLYDFLWVAHPFWLKVVTHICAFILAFSLMRQQDHLNIKALEVELILTFIFLVLMVGISVLGIWGDNMMWQDPIGNGLFRLFSLSFWTLLGVISAFFTHSEFYFLK